MGANSPKKSLTGSIPLIGAVLAGAIAVLAVTLMPAATFESLVWTSGIAALVPAAEPPLGVTARAVLALAGGAMAAAVVWSALYLLFGPGGFLYRGAVVERGAPRVRRADAHRDAPPRRPMLAAELGTPLMEVVPSTQPASVVEAVIPRERSVPANLDERLAAFDPEALPRTRVEPEREPEPTPQAAREPVVPTLARGERMETFELTPIVRRGQESPAGPKVSPSIAELLARLEQGAQRRATQG